MGSLKKVVFLGNLFLLMARSPLDCVFHLFVSLKIFLHDFAKLRGKFYGCRDNIKVRLRIVSSCSSCAFIGFCS